MAALWYFKIEQEKWKKRKIFIGELVKIKKSIEAPIGEKSNTPIREKSNIIIQDNNTTSGIGGMRTKIHQLLLKKISNILIEWEVLN